MKKIITSKNAPAPIGPYSHGVLHGNLLFISGQVGKHPQTGEIPADVEGQTKRVMENLKAILAEAELNFTNVVKTTIFLKDLNDFGKVNEIYGSYFTSDFPARETVEVSRLPLDVLVEISVIAMNKYLVQG
ncbi:MAG: RidA family protein [Bacteroidetes bacterium]|jgi:2-iminobutanoate/2-iminopropanoate deaminase|nr:RidA family protein [Bacteroidota bacterium]